MIKTHSRHENSRVGSTTSSNQATPANQSGRQPIRTVGLIDGILQFKAVSDVEYRVMKAKEAHADTHDDKYQFSYNSEQMEPVTVKQAS